MRSLDSAKARREGSFVNGGAVDDAPAAPRPVMTMEVLTGPRKGKKFWVQVLRGSCSVGRARSSDVRIEDPLVSRRHARIFWSGSRYEIEDFGSANGTLVNDQAVETFKAVGIKHGDVLVFGAAAGSAARVAVVAAAPGVPETSDDPARDASTTRDGDVPPSAESPVERQEAAAERNEALVEYERQRIANIARNEAFLKS